MVTWEYKIDELHIAKGVRSAEETINKLGADGWELVTAWAEQRGAITVQRLMFKRPVDMRRALKQKTGSVLKRAYTYGLRCG